MRILYEKSNVTGQLVEVKKLRYDRKPRRNSRCNCDQYQAPRRNSHCGKCQAPRKKTQYDGYTYQPSMEELIERFPQFIDFMRDYLDQNDSSFPEYEAYNKTDEWDY